MQNKHTNHFTTAQTERTRAEIEMRIDAANVAQWMALNGPPEQRAAAALEAKRHLDALARLARP